jgi:prolyl-tRNA synthetase
MIGAIIMAHSDDLGLVLPPVIAPIGVVIIPIYTSENKEEVLKVSKDVLATVQTVVENAKLDDREFVSAGFKFNEWEKKGVPVRIEIGERDLKRMLLQWLEEIPMREVK